MEGIMVLVEEKPVQPPGSLHFMLVLKPMKHNPNPKTYQTALNMQRFVSGAFRVPAETQSPSNIRRKMMVKTTKCLR